MTSTLPSWAFEEASSIFHNSPNHALKLDIAQSLHHAYQQGKQDGQREMKERAAKVASTFAAKASLEANSRDVDTVMQSAAQEVIAVDIAAAIHRLDEVQDDAT